MESLENTSFDDVARKYKAEEAASAAQAAKWMKEVLVELRKNSVAKVVVDYDGHGDEGFFKKIVFIWPDGKRTEVGEDVRDAQSIHNRIGNFVLSLLPAGWETNEGSFGTWVLDVMTGEYDLKHVWGEGKGQDGDE